MIKDRHYYENEASEAEFLDWYKTQDSPKYEKPAVTADMVAYTLSEGQIKLMLIRRKSHPSKDKLALVGGFVGRYEKDDQGKVVHVQEDAQVACQREVEEEVGLHIPLENIEQLMTVSTPNRDPRGWVITIAHLVYLPASVMTEAKAGDDASQVLFVDVDFQTETLSYQGKVLTEADFAFDHFEMIKASIQRIKGRMDWYPTVLRLLGENFDLHEATALVNLILDKPILINNFLSKFKASVVELTDKRQTGGKPRKLYRLRQLQ